MIKVLVVDDSSTIRIVTSYMLKALGITPILAESPQDALRVCANELPDAVIVDWSMRAMDVEAFRDQLLALTKGFPPKVIYCANASDADRVNKRNDESVMAKPFDLSTLAYHLERAQVTVSPFKAAA